MPEEERNRLLSSEAFVGFIAQSTKYMEKAMNEPYDYMEAYQATFKVNE